jgi:hypothetical protein
MRQGQQNNKRMRNRNNRKGPNPLTRSYESNGGDVKIRGTALHVAEKYVQLARDAQSSGDRVAGENYLQHAEHYYRIVAAAQAQMPQPPQGGFRNDDGDGDDEDEFGNVQGGFGGNNNNNYGGNNPYTGGQNAYGGGNQGGGNNNNNGGGNQGGGNTYQGNRHGQQPNHQGGQPASHQGGQPVNQQGGGQPSYAPADQLPAFINGGAGQPQEPSHQAEGAPERDGEFRQQGGNNQDRGGQNPGGGNFRRRRRPFREPYAGGEHAAAPAPVEGGEGTDE